MIPLAAGNSLCSEFVHSRSNSAIHRLQTLRYSSQPSQEPVVSAAHSTAEDRNTKFERWYSTVHY